MPDHLHWLVRLGEETDLSSLVQRFKSTTSRRINSGEQTRVWARAFHDHALRSEEKLTSVARYIIANPVRAGLVAGAGLYPHWDAIWIED